MPPTPTIAELNQTHTIPEFAQILPGNGNLPKIQITTPAASAEIYLHGAHLTSWHPAGLEEVIFLSRQSLFQEDKAIRGGVPICFPWFRAKADNPQAPAHGVVRTKAWQLDSIAQQGEEVIVSLSTASDEATRTLWPHEFRITHRITIGKQLKLELIVENLGPAPFQFEEALHTYHAVSSVESIAIRGLDAVYYLDNRDNNQRKAQSGEIHFTAPTDNAYTETTHPLEIRDPALNRSIHIEKQNSQTTIVWTPWQQGAQSMADMADEEWQNFACVEASNILAAAVTLPAGESHTMSATIRVSSLTP